MSYIAGGLAVLLIKHVAPNSIGLRAIKAAASAKAAHTIAYGSVRT